MTVHARARMAAMVRAAATVVVLTSEREPLHAGDRPAAAPRSAIHPSYRGLRLAEPFGRRPHAAKSRFARFERYGILDAVPGPSLGVHTTEDTCKKTQWLAARRLKVLARAKAAQRSATISRATSNRHLNERARRTLSAILQTFVHAKIFSKILDLLPHEIDVARPSLRRGQPLTPVGRAIPVPPHKGEHARVRHAARCPTLPLTCSVRARM